MSLPDAIKTLVKQLNEAGYSPEKIVEYFSKTLQKGSDQACSEIKTTAKDYQVIFSDLDFQELKMQPPSRKTIRRWLNEPASKNELLNSQSSAIGLEHTEETCFNSPDQVDVLLLREWGIPKNKAVKILYEWRSWHKQDRHDICRLFPRLREDIVDKKTPFKVAEAFHDAEVWATEFEVARALQDIDLARKYRHWESAKSYDAFIKEVQDLHKPSAEKLAHLETIGELLKSFQSQLDSSLSDSAWYLHFDIEKTSFIQQTGPSHSWEVAFELWEYIHLRENYERYENGLMTRTANMAPKGACEEFSRTAAWLAMDAASRKFRADYRKLQVSNTEWLLEVNVRNEWRIIGRGIESALDDYQMIHVQLINKCKSSSETNSLLVLRKRMLLGLKKLSGTVNYSISKKTYLQGFCTECPCLVESDGRT